MLHDLNTTSDVARWLRCSDQHVRDLIADGKLIAHRIGERGQYRIRREDAERLMPQVRQRKPNRRAIDREAGSAREYFAPAKRRAG